MGKQGKTEGNKGKQEETGENLFELDQRRIRRKKPFSMDCAFSNPKISFIQMICNTLQIISVKLLPYCGVTFPTLV